MKSKAIVFVLLIIIGIITLLSWSYYVARSEVESQLRTNKKTAKSKLTFHDSKIRIINFGGKIRPCWTLYYTPDDSFSDLYVYVSLTGEIIGDSGSAIKRPPINHDEKAK